MGSYSCVAAYVIMDILKLASSEPKKRDHLTRCKFQATSLFYYRSVVELSQIM